MNSAQELLLPQTVAHLLTARYTVEAAFTDRDDFAPDLADGAELGMAFFAAVNAVLKECLEQRDEATFDEIEREWTRMFDDVWLPGFPREDLPDVWADRSSGEVPAELLRLLRYREVLRF